MNKNGKKMKKNPGTPPVPGLFVHFLFLKKKF